MLRGLNMAHPGGWVVGVVVWVAAFAAVTLLRRRRLRTMACQALRDSPNWPQRLARRDA